MTETEKATEFSRRRSMVGVEVRYMPSKRSMTVCLSCGGRDFGSKTTITTRGKATSTLFCLPELT